MAVRMAGTVAHLEGDWSITGVADNIGALVLSLNHMESKGEKSLQINCGQIEETDTSGLQLLNVWVECARLRGIEPKLVNVTSGMQRAIHELGFTQCFSYAFPNKRYTGKIRRPAKFNHVKK
jgi:anti-anti-sigma regulatory factor